MVGIGAGLLIAFILWSIFRDFWSHRKNRKNKTSFHIK
jgi:hypothetical protein